MLRPTPRHTTSPVLLHIGHGRRRTGLSSPTELSYPAYGVRTSGQWSAPSICPHASRPTDTRSRFKMSSHVAVFCCLRSCDPRCIAKMINSCSPVLRFLSRNFHMPDHQVLPFQSQATNITVYCSFTLDCPTKLRHIAIVSPLPLHKRINPDKMTHHTPIPLDPNAPRKGIYFGRKGEYLHQTTGGHRSSPCPAELKRRCPLCGASMAKTQSRCKACGKNPHKPAKVKKDNRSLEERIGRRAAARVAQRAAG